MDKPDMMPNFFGVMMANCWEAKPSERPTFRQLVKRITDFMKGTNESLYLYLGSHYLKFEEENEITTPTYRPESSQSDTEEQNQIAAAQIHFQQDLNEKSADAVESFPLMEIICYIDEELEEEND